MTTPKTGAPEWAASQASPDVTVNEAIRRVEAGAGLFRIEDNDATAPPGSCADGAQYIPAATATGAWAGHETHIAIAVGANASNGWYFVQPEEGMRIWVKDEDAEFAFDGNSPGAWVAYTPTPGAISLDSLTDVDVSSSPAPTDGKVLTYNAALGLWIPGSLPSPGASTLDQLTDVDVSSSPAPTNGKVLTYNSALGLWIPGTVATGATTLDQLTDVDVSSSPAPADGDLLAYNAALGLWIPHTPRIPWEMEVACSDETTALTAGTTKVTFRTPCAVVLTEVRASLSTAQTSGGQLTVDINEAGTTILSTKLIFDNTAKTTVGSSPSAVISDTALADNAEMTVDIDNVGDGTAKGLKVLLKGFRA